MTTTHEDHGPLAEALLDAAAEWLVRLNEPQATQADFEEWQRWLAADPSHARAFHALEGTWQLSAQAAIAHHSRAQPEFTRYRPDEPVSSWVRRHNSIRRRRTWAAAAAILALAGAVGAWWSRQPAVIQTTTGEQRVVWLPDRSRITVGPLTRLSYRFSPATRALRLDAGQAYFEVTKDAHRPFVVETQRGRIVAVGTAFSVDVMPERLNVTVAEGTVRIENAAAPSDPALPSGPTAPSGAALPPGAPLPSGAALPSGPATAGARPLMVTAGRRYISATSGASVTGLPSATLDVSWRDGRLAYYGDPLSAVIADLNRYAPDPIELADPRLGDLQYTGTVFPESINDWLASLQNIFPVRVEHRGRGWLIVQRTTPSSVP